MDMMILETAGICIIGEYKRFGIMCVGGTLGIPWFVLNTWTPIGKTMSQPREEVIKLF